MASIAASAVSKRFWSRGREITALDHFDFAAREGEFICIVGPSGCGKSTFLRILAGLTPASAGSVTVQPRPNRSHNGPIANVVFQEHAIFPWKTVRQNVAFGLQMRRVERRERERIVEGWIERVGLSRFADAYPHQLSGGMKQRVGIARAFANDPEVLLMDEPLGALDAQTRVVLQEEILRIWQEQRTTVVYVTHSIEEAVLLGDRVDLMTAHPGTNKESFQIDLPRPRSIEQTGSAAFAGWTYRIWQALREEVQRALAAESGVLPPVEAAR